MENRFGIKDFFLFLLIAILLATVVLAMFQSDRQYGQIMQIKEQNQQLAHDVTDIQRQLSQGVVARQDGGGQAAESMEVFDEVRKAEKMPGFKRGDWLIDNFPVKVGRLTTLVSTDLYQQIVESRVMECLATRDPQTLKFLPLLAESWEVSPDGLVFRFKLRRGVTFSNGVPFTAQDVVFTFDWIHNPEVNAPRFRAYLDKLKDVKAVGSHEVVFTFSEPYFLSFATVAEQSILSKAFYSRFKPAEFNERTGLLIGTGPYKLEDPENWTPGKLIELRRNDRYWGSSGTFDRLVFREIEDESAEMVLFGNGELDIMSCLPEQYEKMLKDDRIVKMSQHLAYHSPLTGFSYIGWNQQRKVGDKRIPTAFDDKRVRQAMTLLIDRQRIAREVYLGYATAATGPFDPLSPQSDPQIKAWPFDEARAKALLKQAGYQDRNGENVIRGPNGEPFKFKLTYPSGSATYERIILSLKDGFARAGISMQPEPLDWPVMLDKVKRSDFDACTLAWGGSVETDAYQIFHSSQTEGEGDNRTYYINKDLDKAIEEARRTVDDDARMKLWHKVHQILHEDQPYTFLLNSKALVFVNGRLANVSQSKLGLNYVRLSANPVPWFVPAGKQKYR